MRPRTIICRSLAAAAAATVLCTMAAEPAQAQALGIPTPAPSFAFRMPAQTRQPARLPRAEISQGAPLLYREGSALVIPVEGSVTLDLNSWLGVTGDVGVEIGEVLYEKPLYTFLAGPVVSLRSGRLRAFAHALLGGAHSGCAEFSLERGCLGVVAPATALGGGIDIRPGSRIARESYSASSSAAICAPTGAPSA